nr:reverse transcriptase domain-containing protein [Tanacetum cinerariifolium]
MEDEFYNLVIKENDLKTYIRRFQELVLLCPNIVPNSEKLIKVFIGGLPRSIEGNVTASKLQTLEEVITITQRLMEQVINKNGSMRMVIHSVAAVKHVGSSRVENQVLKVSVVYDGLVPEMPARVGARTSGMRSQGNIDHRQMLGQDSNAWSLEFVPFMGPKDGSGTVGSSKKLECSDKL